MEDYNASPTRRGSFFDFLWGNGDDKSSEQVHERRSRLQERCRETEGASSQPRGEKEQRHTEKGRRASKQRGFKGPIRPMATLSSVTAKSKRGGFFWCQKNKIHIHEENSEELAHQLMAAFVDFDV